MKNVWVVEYKYCNISESIFRSYIIEDYDIDNSLIIASFHTRKKARSYIKMLICNDHIKYRNLVIKYRIIKYSKL